MRTYYQLLFVLIPLLNACGGITDPIPDPNYALEVLTGNRQQGLQFEALTDSIVVEVSTGGRAVPNVAIAIMGDGTGYPASLTSDARGRIAFRWILGEAYEQSLTIQAAGSPGSSTVVRATATYNYRIPTFSDDGWEVANIVDYSRNPELVFNGIDRIRTGQFVNIHSLLIAKNGRLLLEQYYPGYTSEGIYKTFDRNTPHELQSASKSFRSALLGIAIDQGFIPGTQTTLFSFFPEFRQLATDGKAEIDLDHLLTMSTGLQWNEWYGTPSDLSAMYARPASEWDSYVLSKPLAFAPGTKFVYNTGASILINRIIERASGLDIGAFTRKYLTDPTQSVLLPGAVNIQAQKTPRHMAKLGQIYLDGGRWKNIRVISQAWVEKSIEKRFPVPELNAHYGYQWWIKPVKSGETTYPLYYASGNGGQFIIFNKELDLVIVSTGGNFDSPQMNQIFPFITTYILPAFI